jgi:RNA polymerase sigma-70 factor (ECF subfamily)
MAACAPIEVELEAGPLDWGTLYRAHAQTVARWVLRLGGPHFDVEDTVQEVFLIVQKRLSSFRGDAKITTWLYGITHNVVRHRRRKDKWRKWLGGSAEEVAGRVPAEGPSPIEQLEGKHSEHVVYEVLAKMRESYRTVLIMFEIEGLSGEEVAQLTGTKVETLWVQLHRARAQFLKLLASVDPSARELSAKSVGELKGRPGGRRKEKQS